MSALRDILDRQMSEEQLSEEVRRIAVAHGWLAYHTRDSRRSPKGFPDWVFVREGRLIFAELKRQTGKTSPEQDKWLNELWMVADGSHNAVSAYVWRPSDFDEIWQELS